MNFQKKQVSYNRVLILFELSFSKDICACENARNVAAQEWDAVPRARWRIAAFGVLIVEDGEFWNCCIHSPVTKFSTAN
jgi:hypothetical protein